MSLDAERDLRVSLDALGLAELSMLNAVDFCKLDVLFLEGSGGLLVVGGKSFAMAAPGGKELDQDDGIRVDELIEVGSGKSDDIRVGVGKDAGGERQEGGGRKETHDWGQKLPARVYIALSD